MEYFDELKQFGEIKNKGVRLPEKFIGYFGEDESEWKDIEKPKSEERD